jgi:tetratricopeptide (TPR) repeat protein
VTSEGQPLVATPEGPDPLVGTLVDDRYRITAVLGSGGMGTVYRAEHRIIGRPVALKVLRPEIGDNPVVMRRFEREAFATGRLEHPNCVTASDGGIMADGSLFLAMELVEGESLSEVLEREGRLPPARAVHILRHVARGLAGAHAAGIVHRDIKPENVLLVEHDGDPDFAKILDFGIAKLLDDTEVARDQHKATQIGMTIGTPTYMSPEQAFGQKVDARTDIYAASVMLFELITGKPPYAADDLAEILAMHVRQPIPSLSAVPELAAVPAELDALIQGGMAKERKARIASAEIYLARLEAVAAALAAAPVPRPVTAPAAISSDALFRGATAPVATPAPMAAVALPSRRRWSPRRRLMAAALAVVAVVVAIGVMIGGGGERRPHPFELAVKQPLSAIAVEGKEMLAKGKHDAAVAYLEANRDEIAADGPALAVLGHAHAARGDHGRAVAAYNEAAEVFAALGREERVAANLVAALESEADDEAAAALIGKLLGRPGADALAERIAAAASDEKMGVRHRARELAERHGLSRRVDRLESYRLDLEQGRRCPDRKEAAVALGKLGDRRAIPILENARKRVRRHGLLRLRRSNTNACLLEAVDEAIARLGGPEKSE